MKLYTEEQVKKAIDLAGEYYDGFVYTEEEIIESLTPIELPSDEEIRNQTQFATNDYYFGAKWMKEQILKQNK